VSIVVAQEYSEVLTWHWGGSEINIDFFVLTSELAVGIAGFSGVVVALEGGGVATWPPVRRRSLRILLQLSALALFFSLLPLVAYRTVGSPYFWRWALGLYGVVHLFDVSTFVFRQPQGAWLTPVYGGYVFAAAQVAIALLVGSAAETTYMVSIVFHLGGAVMGFVFLIWWCGSQQPS
jgi:hypothetical protein